MVVSTISTPSNPVSASQKSPGALGGTTAMSSKTLVNTPMLQSPPNETVFSISFLSKLSLDLPIIEFHGADTHT